MTSTDPLQQFLAGATIDPAVGQLRPDYRVTLIAVDGLRGGASDAASDELLTRAETHARALLDGGKVEELDHVAAWREAYRAFGAKPQRTRNSLEALTRRAPAGLPRVNQLTDVYNAISVLHQLPLGGEDLAQYASSPRLIRASGTEPFVTMADGAEVIEHPDAGEVVWCDDAGVTCRRWNWRQCRRTALTDETTSALFILDVLDPMTDDAAQAAADELLSHLARLGDIVSAQRVVRAS